MSVMAGVIGGIVGGIVVTVMAFITGLLLYAEGERNVQDSYPEDVLEKP